MKTRIHLLLSETFPRNELAFVYPLARYDAALSELGYEVTFLRERSPELLDCDVLVISSKFAKEQGWWSERKADMFAFFDRAREQVDRLIWADLGDSTGATHFEVLPYVDRYWKGAILKDRERYRQKLYGSRVYTDYYHLNFGICDDDPGEPHLNVVPEPDELPKIQVSWNQAFLNYSYVGVLYDALQRNLRLLPYMNLVRFTPPQRERSNDISYRASSQYGRNTVSYQRLQVEKRLNGIASPEKLGRFAFYRELRNSRIVISPFGWGEICYRDFEAIIAGATLVKPNCEHLETWPDMYLSNDTYLPFSWDFSDFHAVLASVQRSRGKMLGVARTAQERYRDFFRDQVFGERFHSLLQN